MNWLGEHQHLLKSKSTHAPQKILEMEIRIYMEVWSATAALLKSLLLATVSAAVIAVRVLLLFISYPVLLTIATAGIAIVSILL